ncbi:ABC transporter ATP-binding protein [Polyangium jinanense]|uniref:ATP-binding cassette domain-containing protein n=1 Tax=Polyangium jinanense TaxID=2829994 RepID=A0A9X3X0F7_9BACT|nr:ABC transporter transmembrane domain-containing protein [Polyangium jinanense]MDC3952661.1 ATP-binding cassette domain-containing protein [Polyangium jinanense]MDC3980280.1 ATP-binding cassette domain-containing protein [Polyangium jinanense]
MGDPDKPAVDARGLRSDEPSDAPKPPKNTSLGRLFGLARPETARLAAGTVFLVIGTLMGLLVPQAFRVILDRAVSKADGFWTIDRAAVALIVLAAVQAASTALRFVYFTSAGERVVTRLRRDLFEQLLAQEIAFFDERKTGELTSRLAADTTLVQNAVSVNISMGLRFAAQVLGGVGFLVYTSPILTAVMLGVVPPVALGAVAYGRRVRKLSREAQDALARANEVAEETIAGIRTVRAFAAEKTEAGRYTKAVWDAFAVVWRRIVTNAVFMSVSSFAAFAALALVLWYGGRLVSQGAMTPGGLTSFLMYTLMVAFSLGGMSELWADLMRASGAAERVFELIDRPPTIPLAEGARPGSVEGRIELSRVSFAYPSRNDVPVLRDLDLAIAPGEVVALVGPSGSGKSTIAALLLRLYDPTEGRITLDGKDLRGLSPEWLRRNVGVVSQEPMLFSCSVADNMRYGRTTATEAEVEAAARAANAHEFVSKFPEGYATLVGERGVRLSGGQKQRVAIARAVLKDPRILVLDEATSALDAESEHLVKEALDRLMKGRTTLIIAHRLSTVMGANRVVVIEDGKIVQSGDHATLMQQGGLYRKLVERQLEGGREGARAHAVSALSLVPTSEGAQVL